MSKDQDRLRTSRRRHNTDVKIARQVKIARARGLTDQDQAVQQPHRMAKHHAMDCGRPGCMLCGNPRKLFKEPTVQERRFDQNIDEE